MTSRLPINYLHFAKLKREIKQSPASQESGAVANACKEQEVQAYLPCFEDYAQKVWGT